LPSFSWFKLLDIVGIGLLVLLLGLSIAFRVSPISFMDPGFPMLTAGDFGQPRRWKPKFPYLYPHDYPRRRTSVYDFDQITYVNDFSFIDKRPSSPSSLSINLFVTWYSDRSKALENLQTWYNKYVSTLDSDVHLITDIPGLQFSSRADAYHLWCESKSSRPQVTFAAESIRVCRYRAAYGPYFFGVTIFRPGGQYFSVQMLNQVLHQADMKLIKAVPKK